ncbi:MAG: DUF3997 domain-containing protein [Clostridia bacterium]|nr:DUF3997 domain-containing protein [Clostridia bacterium]
MFIKQNSKGILRVISFFLIISTMVILFTGCFGGVSDWAYSLPNDYEIWRVNSNSVVFGKNEGDRFEQEIDRYVISFSYNDRYIGLIRIPMDDIPHDKDIDIETMDRSDSEYYIVDSENDIIYGPYTEKEYEKQLDDLGIQDMCEWIETLQRPENAKD